MFTGIIQCIGVLTDVARHGEERRFTVRPAQPFDTMQDGESIAHNGVCLSVESHSPRDYTVYASAETVARSTLGSLSIGDEVNLERALALGDRLGGHLVSGHVDCVAHVRRLIPAGSSLKVELTYPAAYAPEVIRKGSVCLDGISLTINDCGRDTLQVNVIPDTQRRTTMVRWRPGTAVNMETDIIGKYVRRLSQCGMVRNGDMTASGGSGGPAISHEFLRQNGFL